MRRVSEEVSNALGEWENDLTYFHVFMRIYLDVDFFASRGEYMKWHGEHHATIDKLLGAPHGIFVDYN